VRAAVTGATGFVGGHLVEHLLERGARVACLARSDAGAAALAARGCRVVRGALEDAAALRALVAGVEVVFHVAGLVAARNEAAFMRVNRDASADVAAACRAAGVSRLVLVSSLAVTGPTLAGRPLDESARPRPVTPYGRSKLAAEEAVRASGAPFTIVRPPAVYGPRDRQWLRLFRLARRGLVPLLGDGGQELSLVHAADLASALLRAAEAPATLGRVYHAAHPATLSQVELGRAIARAVGARVRLVRLPAPLVRAVLFVSGAAAALAGRATLLSPAKAPELLASAWTCTPEALQRDAGWSAAVPHERGLADTAAWYRRAGWL
jgi:nucleoside-diphosphate-sugar epimerase